MHRDLAPKNLLVRRCPTEGETTLGGPGLFVPGDQLVLADLGISKDLAESSGLTAAAGTVGFAAPEQRAVGIVDERVDVYAASAVVAWLITGERPTDAVAADVAAAGFDPRLGDQDEPGDRDVPDPYYGEDDGFEHVLAIVTRTSRALTDELRTLLAD